VKVDLDVERLAEIAHAERDEKSALQVLPAYIRVTAAAKRLGWPLDRVRQMSNEGKLPPRRRPYGRDDYFRVDELLAALDRLPVVNDAASVRRVRDALALADQAVGRPGHRGSRRRGRGSSGTSA